MKTKLVRTDLTFSTEAEACKLMAEGYILKGYDGITELRMQDGTFRYGSGGYLQLNGVWKDAVRWEVYKEESVEWWNDIPEQGILCWVSDHYASRKDFCTLIYSTRDNGFANKGTGWWRFAKPLTEEEVKQYIYKG